MFDGALLTEGSIILLFIGLDDGSLYAKFGTKYY
jgi:hypothetical protein